MRITVPCRRAERRRPDARRARTEADLTRRTRKVRRFASSDALAPRGLHGALSYRDGGCQHMRLAKQTARQNQQGTRGEPALPEGRRCRPASSYKIPQTRIWNIDAGALQGPADATGPLSASGRGCCGALDDAGHATATGHASSRLGALDGELLAVTNMGLLLSGVEAAWGGDRGPFRGGQRWSSSHDTPSHPTMKVQRHYHVRVWLWLGWPKLL